VTSSNLGAEVGFGSGVGSGAFGTRLMPEASRAPRSVFDWLSELRKSRSAAANSNTLSKRASAFFSRQRRTIASSASGASSAQERSEGGSPLSTLAQTTCTDSPSNGLLPVRSSNSTAPSDQISA